MNNRFQKMHFEFLDFWSQQRFGDIEQARALRTTALIPNDVNSVLDIGCGNGHITNRISKERFVVGVDLSMAALSLVETQAVQTEITAVPFKNRSFDLVMAAEVIEHIPPDHYQQTLAEIARIAGKYILITVPYREQLIQSQISCPQCKTRFHPDYHMRSYQQADLDGLFAGCHFSPIYRSHLLTARINFPFAHIRKLVKNKARFSRFNVCPLCGYHLPDSAQADGGDRRHPKTSPLINQVKHIWPLKISQKMWWVALYQRQAGS